MIIKYSEKLCNQYRKNNRKDIFDTPQKNIFSRVIAYIINSKYRKAVTLTSWLRLQSVNPSFNMIEEAKKIPTCKNYDLQMYKVFRHVRANMRYSSDKSVWGIAERWNTAKETLKLMVGDCEDGSILMYTLARLKGIPANRLWITAGFVQNPRNKQDTDSGHCWLFYKPRHYPLNYVCLDWCYYYNIKIIDNRTLFTIDDKFISEQYRNNRYIPSKYHRIWFIFNEKFAFNRMKRR